VGEALTEAVSDVASGVIHGTSQVGGDLGKAAKGVAVIGVLKGTKESRRRSSRCHREANGARKAAGDISHVAIEQVQKAATGVISGVKVVVKAPFAK
jgi:hypothetical protein